MTIVFILVGILLLFAMFNIVLTVIERKRIAPIGKLVEVNGHKLHVYAEGDFSDKPTLVLMSGHGTPAPVYDFKRVYQRFSQRYRIAVIEKAGYGYSDIANCDRDVDSMLEETREALVKTGEKAPYVLIPHSMSGIEALRWAQKYPSEVIGIVGIDMSVPSVYENMNLTSAMIIFYMINVLKIFGVHRLIPSALTGIAGLDQAEYKQAKYLINKNLFNRTCGKEAKAIKHSTKTVNDTGIPKTNYLMFCSNGKEIGAFWKPCQTEFAQQVNAELVMMDCGHYIHQHEPYIVTDITFDFIERIIQN